MFFTSITLKVIINEKNSFNDLETSIYRKIIILLMFTEVTGFQFTASIWHMAKEHWRTLYKSAVGYQGLVSGREGG